MKPNLTYSEAYSELEKLVDQMEDDSVSLDTLAEKVKKANELIRYCENKLRTIEAEVKKEFEAGKRKSEDKPLRNEQSLFD